MKNFSLDSVILNFFQKVSDWFQIHFGITNFFLARVFIISGLSSGSLGIFYVFRSGNIFLMNVAMAAMLCRVGWLAWTHLGELERHAYDNPLFKIVYSRSQRLVRSLLVWVVVGITIVAIAMSPSTTKVEYRLYIDCIDGMSFAFFCFTYFASCTPKPPSKSTARKLIEKLSNLLSPTGLTTAKA